MAIQLFEAVVGFFFFITAAFFIIYHIDQKPPNGMTIYRMELAVSSWNSLYATNVLKNLTLDSNGEIDDTDGQIKERLCELGKETGMCYFVGGGRISNCPFAGASGPIILNEERISIEKTLIVKDHFGNIGFRKVTFTIAPPTRATNLCSKT